MADGVTWNSIFPIVASLFGVLASALMGMAVSKLQGIETHLSDMNGKLFAHLMDGSNHGAGFARTDEHLKRVEQAVQVAHTRIDHLKAESS